MPPHPIKRDGDILFLVPIAFARSVLVFKISNELVDLME